MAGNLVAFDTQILIWGVRQQGPNDKISRAKQLFHDLENKGDKFMIPAVAVSEFVIPAQDQARRNAIVSAISKRFSIMPFDAQCAALAATLFNDHRRNYQTGAPGMRDCCKSDALIVATAKVHGASTFYTDDSACHTMAQSVMKAEKLPYAGLFPPT